MLLEGRLFGFLVRESRYRRWWHLLASSCGQRLYINPVILRAGLGMLAWAPLLVVVTRSCAAGPDRWQCGRPAWTTTCGVNLRMKGPGYPLVRPILPSLWPMPPSLRPTAPPRVDRTRAHHTYPPHQGLTPATQQDLSPSHAPRRTPFAARRPMVAARCSLPVARRPSLRVRRCHDPRVGGQRAQPGNPQRIRNVGRATRPGHSQGRPDKRNDVRRGPAQAS